MLAAVWDTEGMAVRILVGDVRQRLAELPDESVHCAVTSPPYFGLRSYVPDGVRLKGSLSPEIRAAVLAGLRRAGIFPLPRTSE